MLGIIVVTWTFY